MTNNIKNNDLYIILSSIESKDNGYSVLELRNYAVATKSADALIKLLEIEGSFYMSDNAVKSLVEEKIAENPCSARGMHLEAHKRAVEYGWSHWGSADTGFVRNFIREKNQKAREIKELDKEIAHYDGKGEFDNLLESLDEKIGRRALKVASFKKNEMRLKTSGCETIYNFAMNLYEEEAKSLNPAEANISKAKAHLIQRAYGFDDNLTYSYDELSQASSALPKNLELKYNQIHCALTDKELTFAQCVINFNDIADQDLSEECEKAIVLGENYEANSSADEMVE